MIDFFVERAVLSKSITNKKSMSGDGGSAANLARIMYQLGSYPPSWHTHGLTGQTATDRERGGGRSLGSLWQSGCVIFHTLFILLCGMKDPLPMVFSNFLLNILSCWLLTC